MPFSIPEKEDDDDDNSDDKPVKRSEALVHTSLSRYHSKLTSIYVYV